jgi:hypothetical protein
MARKKTKKQAPRRRRTSSVGAAAGSMLMEIGGTIIGAVVARQVSTKLLPNLDNRIKSIGVVGLGVMLPKMAKNPLMKSIGNGMIAVGGLSLVGSIVPALGAADDVLLLSGLDELGFAEINEVNGIDEIGEISEVNGFSELEIQN